MAVAQRVYAEALLGPPRTKDRVAAVRKGFDEFAEALEGSDELRRFLVNPQVESQTKRAALEDLLGKAPTPSCSTSCACSRRKAGSARSPRCTRSGPVCSLVRSACSSSS